jgi:sec-independent protein translocase protein TatA
MIGSLGLPELLLIFLIVVVIFGAGKLPQLGKGLGDGIRNFRESMRAGAEAFLGRRIFRSETLWRSVFRWMPSERAARMRFPSDKRTAPVMYFFSNSFRARSRLIPCVNNSSMTCWSFESRFTPRLQL